MLSFPAALRNREAILKVLQKYFDLEVEYKVLEIASGSGEHVSYFAQQLPKVTFQPSELNPRYLHSIVAYIDHYRLPNVKVPLHIDVSKAPDFWPLPAEFGPCQLDAVLNINMIHISPTNTTDGLFRAARGFLKPKTGILFLYGPFSFNGKISPQSNLDFDKSLREQNPKYGLRDIKDLEIIAKHNELCLQNVYEMPANNHVLVFIKR